MREQNQQNKSLPKASKSGAWAEPVIQTGPVGSSADALCTVHCDRQPARQRVDGPGGAQLRLTDPWGLSLLTRLGGCSLTAG